MDEKLLKSVLKKIYHHLKYDNRQVSLFCGSAGEILLSSLYFKNVQEKKFTQKFQKALNNLVSNSFYQSYKPFCTGQAGIYWIFTYLYKEGYLEESDFQVLSSNKLEFEDAALAFMESGNYDFLHGAIGIAYYLLYLEKSDEVFFKKIFEKLQLLSNNDYSMIPFWDVNTRKLDDTKINLGLAHGILSILKYSMECYKKNICQAEAMLLSKKIVDFLISNSNVDRSFSFFSSCIENGKVNEFSRLGWCYGDLSIGYILYQYGVLFNEESIISFSLEILKHTIQRRDHKYTLVMDAGLCHGSAGIAHIYNRLWHDTKDYEFKEATDFWMERTLNFANISGNAVTYTKYNPTTRLHEEDAYLLEGSVGIGLVLMSYISSDFSWDYCLMLNN